MSYLSQITHLIEFHWSSVKDSDRVGMYYFPKDQKFHKILQFNLNRTRMTWIYLSSVKIRVIRAIRVPLQYYS